MQTTGAPTSQPSLRPTGVIPTTLSPTMAPTLAPTTLSPSALPSEDPLAGCDPIIPCDIDEVSEGVLFCVEGEATNDSVDVCIPVSAGSTLTTALMSLLFVSHICIEPTIKLVLFQRLI